jgi:threonine dehydrogenase-like Zn-dependent dehydrogenase
MTTALEAAQPSSMVGFVGLPHGIELLAGSMFSRNVGVRGGGAPARVYIPESIGDVLEGRLDSDRAVDYKTDLDPAHASSVPFSAATNAHAYS